MTGLPNYLIQYTKWKWEFLRRNPKYVDEWEKLQAVKRNRHGKEEPYSTVEEVVSSTLPLPMEMTYEETVFCKKWKILFPMNPRAAYDDIFQIPKKVYYIESKINELREKGVQVSRDKYLEIEQEANAKYMTHPKEKINAEAPLLAPNSKSPGRKNKKTDNLEDLDFGTCRSAWTEDGIDFHRLMYQWVNPELLTGRPITELDAWDYDHDGKLPLINVSDKVAETGILAVQIDLRCSKSRLTKEFKLFLDEWKELYEDANKKFLYRKFREKKEEAETLTSAEIMRREFDPKLNQEYKKKLRQEFEKIYKKELRERQRKYEKKYHFDNFDTYLKVYDLRKQGATWGEIMSTLCLNSIQTARNHYRSACELIDKGVEAYVQ
jgi:hypothetical protein